MISRFLVVGLANTLFGVCVQNVNSSVASERKFGIPRLVGEGKALGAPMQRITLGRITSIWRSSPARRSIVGASRCEAETAAKGPRSVIRPSSETASPRSSS